MLTFASTGGPLRQRWGEVNRQTCFPFFFYKIRFIVINRHVSVSYVYFITHSYAYSLLRLS